MLKKIYKKNGIIIISNKKECMGLLYSLINGYNKKDYYLTLGYQY